MASEPRHPTWDGSPQGDPSEWDEEWAAWLLGKYALAGVTYLLPDGETIESRTQYHGGIVRVERNVGVTIECEGVWSGKTICLPPHLQAFEPASPGEYRLKCTQETVEDPDVTTSWAITTPQLS
jgi:hypothetical protein